MPSTFSWLDYSEKDRQGAQRLIDSLREHDTRDELGIGTVRDALSDLLFPGTTTIQTRPKYFLLVPWAYLALERWAGRGHRSLSDLKREARWRELNLLDHLMEADDKEGVIGREAGKELQRLPSSIYWNGLSVLGIRVFPGSLTQLQRVLTQGQVGRLVAQVEGDEAPIDGDGFWHAGMPVPPKSFPIGQTLELNLEEASYLKDRIQSRVAGTLLEWLVGRGDFGAGAEAPWGHPLVGELPAALARQLEHARVFSELMHGAALLYNLMLAEKAQNAKRIDQHGKNLASWADQVVARRVQLQSWDREHFWATVLDVNPRITTSTQTFVNSWMDLALNTADPTAIRDSKVARTLIEDRELRLKGYRRARLFEPRALEMWSGDAGTGRLVYRWDIVQAIVRDISAGLSGDSLMLDPRERTLLFEALRPPDGYTLHSAVGTTYSLDLMALLAAPLAFTIFDCEDRDGRVVMDPLVLLEALRQHARRVTIFCQAGRIAVPRQHRPLLGYLESSVVEAVAPNRHGSFHPKAWALRFEHDDLPVRYRLLCLSRNLTFDRSWNTALVLDGELTDRKNSFADNHPIGDFFQALPGMAVQEVPDAVAERVGLIQDEIRRVKFDLPEGFEEMRFWPFGLTQRKTWPFPNTRRRMMVISPFLTNGILKELSEGRDGSVLVGREESLDGLNPATFEGFERVFSMAPEAEPEEPDEASTEGDEGNESLSGLHAKLYVMDDGWDARMWTGSANATEAAFTRNVELLVELRGKKSHCGIDAVLGGGNGRTSFVDLLRPYSPPEERPPPPDGRLEMLAEGVRRDLARAGLRLVADEAGDAGTWDLAIEVAADMVVNLPEECSVRCWPVSLPEDRAAAFESGDSPAAVFKAVSWQALTTFMALSVEASDDAGKAEVRFVLNLPLEGGPADRQDRLLEQVLTDRVAVLRFLLLLLADDVQELSAIQSGSILVDGSAAGRLDLAIGMPLFESLVRALDRDPARLDRVDRLMKELHKSESGRKLLPDGFEELWASIWKARQELGNG